MMLSAGRFPARLLLTQELDSSNGRPRVFLFVLYRLVQVAEADEAQSLTPGKVDVAGVKAVAAALGQTLGQRALDVGMKAMLQLEQKRRREAAAEARRAAAAEAAMIAQAREVVGAWSELRFRGAAPCYFVRRC